MPQYVAIPAKLCTMFTSPKCRDPWLSYSSLTASVNLRLLLHADLPSKWPYILSSFDEAAHTMGLNTSWSKTKIQNLGHGVTPAPVQLQGHVVESTDRFKYLGSDIHSCERSTKEILRRIGLASNIFARLANIWKRTVYRRRYGTTMPLSSPY